MMIIRWELDAKGNLSACMCDAAGEDVAASAFTTACPPETWQEFATPGEFVTHFACVQLGVPSLDGLDVTIRGPV